MAILRVPSYPVSQPLPFPIVGTIGYSGLVVIGTDNKTIYKLNGCAVPTLAGSQNVSLGAIAYDPGAKTYNTATYWGITPDAQSLYKIVLGPSPYQVSSTFVGSLGISWATAVHGLVDAAGQLWANVYGVTTTPNDISIILSKTNAHFSFGAGNGFYGSGLAYDPLGQQSGIPCLYVGEVGNPGGSPINNPNGNGLFFANVPPPPPNTLPWGFQYIAPLTYPDGTNANASSLAVQYTGGNSTLWMLDNVSNYLSSNRVSYTNQLNITAASVPAYPGMTWGWIPW
jgi:hypothetical protein